MCTHGLWERPFWRFCCGWSLMLHTIIKVLVTVTLRMPLMQTTVDTISIFEANLETCLLQIAVNVDGKSSKRLAVDDSDKEIRYPSGIMDKQVNTIISLSLSLNAHEYTHSHSHAHLNLVIPSTV